jgi:putative hydrolase of the HAD superfamily
VQRRKIAALDLERLVDVVVYAHEHGDRTGKPDPAGFLHALGALDVPADHSVMVGDDPARDIAAARALGMWTIRVERGPHRRLPSLAGAGPHLTVEALDQVPAAVGRLVQERA